MPQTELDGDVKRRRRLLSLRVESEHQPLQPCRARIARNPRICDLGIDAPRAKGRLQFRGITVALVDAITRKQAVAESQNIPLWSHHGNRRQSFGIDVRTFTGRFSSTERAAVAISSG